MYENNYNTPKDHSKVIVLAVSQFARCYIDGYSSLKFLYEIIEVQKNNIDKYSTNYDFFNFLWGVSYQSIIINLSNILVATKKHDSLNIYYLQNLIANQKQYDQNWKDDLDLSRIIQEITGTYSSKKVFYDGLMELRDKYIAHIDRSRFLSQTSPSTYLSLDEIKCAYDSIENLISKLIYSFGIDTEMLNLEQLDKAVFQFRLVIHNMKPESLI
jgi:hypothetical protein